jgi:CheY-like chemotaxis protein
VSSIPRPRILLVDDDELLLNSLTEILGASYEVTATASLTAALSYVRTQPDFDVVVTDLALGPPSDKGAKAISLIEELRAEHPLVPIVVFSGLQGDQPHELMRLGISEIVKKGEDPGGLHRAIQRAINESPRNVVRKPEEEGLVRSLSTVLSELFDRYAPIKEKTLYIPGEGHFELIKPLVGFKRDIERQLKRFDYSENVFLMMKFRSANEELGEFIIDSLRNSGLRGVRADHPDWNLTRNVYNPIAVLYCCKYGIALFDEPEANQAYSANVAYELGMMHYQSKNCLILKHSQLPQIPFDLIKDLYVSYERDLILRRYIMDWIRQIREPQNSGGVSKAWGAS